MYEQVSDIDYFRTLVADPERIPLLEAAASLGKDAQPDLDLQEVLSNVDVQARDAGILLKIMKTNPSDPIRDLHLWMPDYNDAAIVRESWQPGSKFSPFHPLFKERLAPFSTLRFVDWTATNWTTPHTWTERTTFNHVRQSGDKNGKKRT